MDWVTYQNQVLTLEEGVVHVWRIFLPDFLMQLERLWQIISETERHNANRFLQLKDRNQYLITKACQRMILARYLNLDPRVLHFETSSHGKPYLLNNQDYQFNLSHSGDYALLAIAKNIPVGVDVEKVREIAVMPLAVRFFSEKEQPVLAAMTPPEQSVAFFKCWVKKEAFIKATGLGLSFPFSEFSVDIEAAQTSLVDIHNNKERAANWVVQPLALSVSGYYAALSTTEQFEEIVCWSYGERVGAAKLKCDEC